MGISASATLAYGVLLGDETPYGGYDSYTGEYADERFEDFDGEFGEYLAIKAGYEDPWENCPEDYTYAKRDQFPDFSKKLDEWRDTVAKLASEAPVTVHHYGMPVYDYSAYAIILSDGNCQRYTYDSDVLAEGLPLEPYPEQIKEAEDFCKEHGLPSFEGASWVLTTNVG